MEQSQVPDRMAFEGKLAFAPICHVLDGAVGHHGLTTHRTKIHENCDLSRKFMMPSKQIEIQK